MCVVCVLCLIVVPLPPGENPFAVKINNKNYKHSNGENVSSEVFTAMNMENTVFWDGMSYSLVNVYQVSQKRYTSVFSAEETPT
jgi:hypothetical protein